MPLDRWALADQRRLAGLIGDEAATLNAEAGPWLMRTSLLALPLALLIALAQVGGLWYLWVLAGLLAIGVAVCARRSLVLVRRANRAANAYLSQVHDRPVCLPWGTWGPPRLWQAAANRALSKSQPIL
jgi:hypothetical protein